MESNDSPEIQDRGETSDIPGFPSGGCLANAKKPQKNNNNKTRERDRVAAKTEPVNGNDKPSDCQLCGQEVRAAVERVYYFRIQLGTITSY